MSGAERAPRGPLRAVLFDMDGVITDTARAHAGSWKRLFDELLRARGGTGEARPFDVARDYRTFVDGKPRHDGIRSFLASRGITLPEGEPDDPPEAETVVALGKRKQAYFEEWLEARPVEVYPGSRRLLGELRARGIPVAVFSSSRNTERVLRSAGVLDLFDARVDGNDLLSLGIPGKPDPAMLLEAAARLGVTAASAAVVEDAISGVTAGARGGFGLVVGVARGEHREELARAGADLVVHDLAELELGRDGRLAVKTLASVPSIWDREDDLRARLVGQKPAVFLDYDGTLTPIVENPDDALLPAAMREAIAALAARCEVAIISGRGLDHIARLVSLDSVTLAGSHGFEIVGPGGVTRRLERGVELVPAVDEAERRLRERLASIAGHQVERKRFSVAIHYRRAAPEDVPRIEAIVDEVIASADGLRKGHGKKVFRIQPDIEWDKGRAVLWILEQLEPGLFPIYVGDDLTDEDAFRALAGRAITVAVRDEAPRATAADYALDDVDAVKRFLELLTSLAPSSPGGAP